MGQKKWLETEQSVSDILKLKPGLDFDQEEKEMRIQRIMNLAAFKGKKERIGFGNFLVRQISYTGWKIWWHIPFHTSDTRKTSPETELKS